MKKLIALSIIYIILFISICCVGVSHSSNIYQPPMTGEGQVQSEVLTKQQKHELQVLTDIFGMCTLDNAVEYVVYGFSTEYSIGKGIMACNEETTELITYMENLGVDKSSIADIMNKLVGLMIQKMDNDRNEFAERLMKEKESETQL